MDGTRRDVGELAGLIDRQRRDAAGRETTATAVIVNVRNDLTPPTVVIAAPSAGTTMSSSVVSRTRSGSRPSQKAGASSAVRVGSISCARSASIARNSGRPLVAWP